MGLKKILKKWLPHPDHIKKDSRLNHVKHHLFDPNIWHLNRSSVSKGVAIGLLIAFIPLPIQMLMSAILAIIFRANLIIAIVMTWITNPITFLPINYFVYKVGTWVTRDHSTYSVTHEFEWHGKSLYDIFSSSFIWLQSVGKPFLIGLPIVAISSAVLGYFLIHFCWKGAVYLQWKKRKNRRK